MKFFSLFFTLSLVASTCSLGAMERHDQQQDQKKFGEDFCTAAKKGNVKVLQRLLASGGNVDARAKDDQRTALMQAAKSSHTSCLKLLIQYGADPSLRNRQNETAFDLAFKYGFIKCVDVLLSSGVQKCVSDFVQSCSYSSSKISFEELSAEFPEGTFTTDSQDYIQFPISVFENEVFIPLLFQIIDYADSLLGTKKPLPLNDILRDLDPALRINNLLEHYGELIALKKQYLESDSTDKKVLEQFILKSKSLLSPQNNEGKNQGNKNKKQANKKEKCQIF